VATLETDAGRTAKTQNDQESTTSRPLRNERGSEGRFLEETTPRGRDARKQVRPSGFTAHGTTVRAANVEEGSSRRRVGAASRRIKALKGDETEERQRPENGRADVEDQTPEGVRNAGRGWHGRGWDLVAARADAADSTHLER
jgi:hypothetical protein